MLLAPRELGYRWIYGRSKPHRPKLWAFLFVQWLQHGVELLLGQDSSDIAVANLLLTHLTWSSMEAQMEALCSITRVLETFSVMQILEVHVTHLEKHTLTPSQAP